MTSPRQGEAKDVSPHHFLNKGGELRLGVALRDLQLTADSPCVFLLIKSGSTDSWHTASGLSGSSGHIAED